MITEIEFIKRVLISGILSGIIGFEREKHGREAGLRTMILVGMGTTAILSASFQVYNIFSQFSDQILRIDPARIAYGVVTGMGFLGAGVIIKEKERIRGLTTAASMWLVTSIGLTVGTGLYFLSLFITITSVFVLYFLRILEKRFPIDTYNFLSITLSEINLDIIEEIEKILQDDKYQILTRDIKIEKEKRKINFNFTLRHRHPKEKTKELLKKFSEIKNLEEIEIK